MAQMKMKTSLVAEIVTAHEVNPADSDLSAGSSDD
jgi:hypothetical protein